MPPGQDSLLILVDYASCTMRTNPSIGTAHRVLVVSLFLVRTLPSHPAHSFQVLTILQQHYVERLGRAIVVNLPLLLNFFYKGISPFLDPVTKEKVRRMSF